MTARTPPQAIEAERDTLAACLLDRDACNAVRVVLQSADAFYEPKHRAIYRAILAVASRSEPVDIATVDAELGRMGARNDAGGTAYVMQLTMNAPIASAAVVKARIVAERYMKRATITAATEAIAACYDETTDAFGVLDDVTAAFMALSERRGTSNTRTMSQAVDAAIERIALAKAARMDGRLLGISTGLTRLDNILGGLQPTNHTVVGARTSMGKTGLALRMAMGAATESPGLFFSLEMASVQIATRALAAQAGVSAHGLFTGAAVDCDGLAASAASEVLRALPIMIEDTSGLTLAEIGGITRREMKRRGVKWVFVDYLGLIRAPEKSESREREVAAISAGLKNLAKQLDIPVVSLVQLNREAAKGQRPSLANLAEADAISRDADAVVLLHRPEYYGQLTDDEGNSTAGVAECIVDKNRNGPTGTIRLAFLKERATFENLVADDNAPPQYPTNEPPPYWNTTGGSF